MLKIKNAEYVKEEVKCCLREYLEMKGIKIKRDEFKCFNPAHEDNKPSAGLSKDGKGFKCLGCGLGGDIFTAYCILEGKSIIGKDFYIALKELADLFDVKYELEKEFKIIKEKEYIYRDYNGKEIYKIERYHKEDENGKIVLKQNGKTDKTFLAFTWEDGKWIKGINLKSRCLYNLPEVTYAIKNNQKIYFVEGEKCADIIKDQFGLTATAIAFGSNSWVEPYINDYKNQLKGANVVLIPDNDKTGTIFMDKIANDLKNIAKSIKIIKLSLDKEIPETGDIEDWIKLGGNKRELLRLVEDSEDIITKECNWYEKDKNGKVNINNGLLARYLINKYPAIFLNGRFYLYSNGVYKECREHEVQGIIKENLDDRWCKMNLIRDIEGQWEIDKKVRVNPENIDKNPKIINIKNGLYDINNEKLMEHNPDFISTTQLDVNYNPNAKGEMFIKFLNEILPEKESQMLVQEIAGYSMSLYNKAKKFFIFYGLRDTGKTTLLNLIMTIISPAYLTHINLQNLTDRFNKAELYGKLANIATELPDGGIKDVGFIKALIGQDPILAEKKGKDPFTFTNKAKLIFACNNLPKNYGDRTDAFYNKMMIVQFKNQVSKENIDVMLPEKLEKEKEFVFLWAMQGLKRLINNGFVFTTTLESDKLVQEYKIRCNNVLAFVSECCAFNENSEIASERLYTAYKEYCKINNTMVVSKYNFKQEIRTEYEGKIFERLVTNRRLNGYKGITFNVNWLK